MPLSDSEQADTSHPASVILTSPLQEESRRNRRALLSVASVCIALRLLGKFPEQISAVGIRFPKSDAHVAHVLILSAVGLQIYLFVVFVLSAMGDYLLWRRALRGKIKAYAVNNCKFEVGEAVDLGVEDLKKLPWRMKRLEASDSRMKHVFGGTMNKEEGVVRMIWNSHPWTIVYLAILFFFPVLWFLVSTVSLLSWTPGAR